MNQVKDIVYIFKFLNFLYLLYIDVSKKLDCSMENSMRKDNRFVKNSISYRSTDHITSLKRRVRKVYKRNDQCFCLYPYQK